MHRVLPAVALAVLLAACGDVNAGASGSVVEGHVTRVLETGQRTPVHLEDRPALYDTSEPLVPVAGRTG